MYLLNVKYDVKQPTISTIKVLLQKTEKCFTIFLNKYSFINIKWCDEE